MAEELIVCLNAFYALYAQTDGEIEKEIPLFWDVSDSWWTDSGSLLDLLTNIFVN